MSLQRIQIQRCQILSIFRLRQRRIQIHITAERISIPSEAIYGDLANAKAEHFAHMEVAPANLDECLMTEHMEQARLARDSHSEGNISHTIVGWIQRQRFVGTSQEGARRRQLNNKDSTGPDLHNTDYHDSDRGFEIRPCVSPIMGRHWTVVIRHIDAVRFQYCVCFFPRV